MKVLGYFLVLHLGTLFWLVPANENGGFLNEKKDKSLRGWKWKQPRSLNIGLIEGRKTERSRSERSKAENVGKSHS